MKKAIVFLALFSVAIFAQQTLSQKHFYGEWKGTEIVQIISANNIKTIWGAIEIDGTIERWEFIKNTNRATELIRIKRLKLLFQRKLFIIQVLKILVNPLNFIFQF